MPRKGSWIVRGPQSENPSWNSQNNTLNSSGLPLTEWPSLGATVCLSSAFPIFLGSQTMWDLGRCISHLYYYPTSTVFWPWSLLALDMCNMCSFPCRVRLHLSSNKWEMLQKMYSPWPLSSSTWLMALGEFLPCESKLGAKLYYFKDFRLNAFFLSGMFFPSPKVLTSLWGSCQVPSPLEASLIPTSPPLAAHSYSSLLWTPNILPLISSPHSAYSN